MQGLLLEAGGAYAAGALLVSAGVRAAWRALMPKEGVDWFCRQTWTDAQLAELGRQWAEVWWTYLTAAVGADAGTALALEVHVVRVADAGSALLRTESRTRAIFAAILFQLAVTLRHDQNVCAVTADPARPPFYGHYVNRTHLASLFSLRSLLKVDATFACARRTTDAFRGIRGKVVAEFRGADGTLIRRPRDKIRRFKCSHCVTLARKGRSGRLHCKQCTRLQEHHPEGLVQYYSNQHSWVPVPDAHTVCGDVVFEQARRVEPGARVAHDGHAWEVHKVTRGHDDSFLKIHLRRRAAADVTLCRTAKSVVAVLRADPDCARMLLDAPRVVHGMSMSVEMDKIWRQRAGGVLACARKPLTLDRRNPQKVHEYALWRGLAAMARWASGNAAWDDARTHVLLPQENVAHV
jgi:hypothetical protein